MSKYNLVLLDEELDYLNNLMNYISQNYSYKFNVVSFTELKYMEEYLNKNNKVDIILISPNLYDEQVVLRHGTSLIFLVASENQSVKSYPFVKKYQAADKICGEIIRIFENAEAETKLVKDESLTKVITVYSPIGGIGKTTLSLSMAENLSQKSKKVLYISLEPIQSYPVFLKQKSSKFSFSDVLFSIKQKDNEVLDIISKGIIKDSDTGIFYFNPVDSILELEDLSSQDIKDLIEAINSSRLFQYMVIDLPATMNTKYYELFRNSHKVILPIGQDAKTVVMVDSLINQLDEYDNFFFLQNKVKEASNSLLPKIILNQSRPMIESIGYFENLQHIADLKSLRQECSDFSNKVNNIVINNILF
jgi:cellulose biosynthesis protein BcsQ